MLQPEQRRMIRHIVRSAKDGNLTEVQAARQVESLIEMEDRDIKFLEEFRKQLMGNLDISPSMKVWLYDQLYLPVNNRLASIGIGRHDDGQLS